MPIQIKHTSHVGHESVNVWPMPGHGVGNPYVGIGFGALFALLKPHEARELAHALVEAADAATRKQEAEA